MVRIFIPWGIGIAIGLSFPWQTGWKGLGLFWVSFFLLLSGYFFTLKSYRLRHLFGGIAFLFLLYAGWFFTSWKITYTESRISNREKGVYFAEVLSPGRTSNNVLSADCRILYRIHGKMVQNANFRLVVFFPQEVKENQIRPGQQFCFNGRILKSEPPRNPEEFDYGRYLLLKGISGYVKPKREDIVWGSENKYSIRSLAWRVREFLLEILEKYEIPEKERSVLAALSLGYREDLSEETTRAFRAAGAMHVLAVSGLHVGIIYLLFHYITFFLQRKKWGRILRVFLGMGFLWGYAFLTGLSPSVVRAATMFSFFLVSGLLERKVHSLNILASALFVLLAIDPFLLSQPGFQLSASAVAAIVLLYPKLSSIINPPNSLVAKMWSLLATTLAAQAGTSILSVLYFHQFPVYFALANLIVVPLAGWILYGTVLLYFLAWWPWVASLVTKILSFFTGILNNTTIFIESLPGSVISGLWISRFQAVLLGLTIASTIVFLYYKKASYLQLALLGMIGSMLISVERIWNVHNRDMVAVFSVPYHSAVLLKIGNQRLLVCDSLLQQQLDLILRKTENFRFKEKLDPVQIFFPGNVKPGSSPLILMDESCLAAVVKNKTVIISGNWEKKIQGKSLIKADVLILTGKKFQNPDGLVKWFNPGVVVADASVPAWCNKWYEAYFNKVHVRFHQVTRDGAYILHVK